MGARILFIDRDGTLIEEPEDFQVDALQKVRLVPGVIPALLELQHHGYEFVMVTNQDGLGTASFPTADFDLCQNFMLDLFASQGIEFAEIFVCPHLPTQGCDCRKPRAGLLTAYLAAKDIRLGDSAVIGDRSSDAELADRIGVRSFTITPANAAADWQQVVTELCWSERTASVTRNTNETRIHIDVNLDQERPAAIATGIGFFDHMLEQIAKHSGIGLTVQCDGDLEVDDHHSIEDTALCLGAALREAVGGKIGIGRYGFVVPMDESEARVALDLSGRSRFVFDGEFPTQRVGGLATEMVPHFFQSLADALGAALHLEVRGENSHHMVEACFKATGRALRQALRRDGDSLPSTKGTLA